MFQIQSHLTLRRLQSLAAAFVLCAASASTAWAQMPTFTWTASDYADDPDNGIRISAGAKQILTEGDSIDLTYEVGHKLTYVVGSDNYIGREATQVGTDEANFPYYFEVGNNNGSFIIDKVSGHGTLKVIVSGDASGTITATWKSWFGYTWTTNISAYGPFPTVAHSNAVNVSSSSDNIKEIEIDLSSSPIAYSDIVLTFSSMMKIYAVIWMPSMYLFVPSSDNKCYGNTTAVQNVVYANSENKLWSNYGKNIYVGNSNSYSSATYSYGNPLVSFPNSISGSNFITCNRLYYNQSAIYIKTDIFPKGVFYANIYADNIVTVTDITKDKVLYNSNPGGGVVLKFDIDNGSQLKIERSSNSAFYLYSIAFIPDKSVTDCVKVASRDLTSRSTITTNTRTDTTFNYTLKYTYRNTSYTINATRTASSATASSASNVAKGYVYLGTTAATSDPTETEVSVTTEAGTNLRYSASVRDENVSSDETTAAGNSGSQSDFAYLQGKTIKYNNSDYTVNKNNTGYYITYGGNRYYLQPATYTTQIVTTTTETVYGYKFVKWTSDDEGLYDYGADKPSGSRLSDGTTMYAQFRDPDQKVLNCAAECVSGESEGLGKPKVSTSKVLQGDEVIFSVDMVSGAEFIGWYRNENGNTLISSSQTYRIDPRDLDFIGQNFSQTDLTLYAKMRHRSFTVQAGTVEGFENGTTSWTATNVTYGKVPSGEAATFTATADATSQFAGWYSDNAGTNFVSGDESYTMVIDTTTTLYAKFVSTAADNLCTFNVNTVGQGTVSTDNTYLAVGDTYPATINTYKGQAATFIATPASGYRFVGWTLDGTTITGTDRSLNVSLTSDSHTLVANFISDGRNPNSWSGNPNDWLWGEQTTTNKIGNFTFKASSQSPTYFNADASSPISYNGTTYSYPYSFTLKPTNKGNYIGLETDRAGLLTILVRNTSDIARTINIYENTSAYSSAASLSASLDVPTTIADGEYTTLTYNVTNAASFVIAADGPLDIYMIKYQTQHTVTVEAVNGTVTSKKVTTTSEVESDLTEDIQSDASYWNPTTWGFTHPNSTLGTIQQMPTSSGPSATTRDGRNVQLVEEYQKSAKHITTNETGATDTVLMQRITNLEPGIYQVTVYANAYYTGSDATNGITTDGLGNIACVFANYTNQFIPAHIGSTIAEHGEYTLLATVTDNGLLDIGMFLARNGTNWHSMQIKSIDNLTLWSVDMTASTGVNIAHYNNNNYFTETSPNDGITDMVWQRAASNPGTNPYSNFGEVPALTGDGGIASVYRNDGTSVDIVERYAQQQPNAGKMIWQEIKGMEPGSYTITLFASSCYTGDRNTYYGAGTADNLGQSPVQDGNMDYTYVYANETKLFIPSFRASQVSAYEEVTLTTTVGEDSILEFGLALAKVGTNWHCIQVKSLYYNSGVKLVNSEETYHMTATPNEGYRFTGWTLDNSSAGNGDQTLTFTVSQDHNIVANFTIDGRDPFLWEGEPLDWIYGSQTAAKTLGIYTFKSNASYATTFEKSNDADVNQFDNEEAYYNHRWVLGGQSQTGSRYLLVEPTETGTLQMLVRDPSATPSANLKFYNNTSTFKSLSSAADKTVAITNSNGDYQLVEYEVSSLNPFVVEATASVEIYALRFNGEGIMTIPTNGAIPDGVTLTEATIGNVTDPASTMYGSNVVTYSGAKASELSVPHYVKVTAIKLHGTSASTSPSRVTIAEATSGTRSQQIAQDQSTKLSDVKYTIENPTYGQTFNITTEENGFQGIMTLYGEIRDHFAEPVISYDYKTKLLTMTASEGADIYYTTDSEAGMTYANSRYVGTKYESAIDLSSYHSGSMTFYAVASKDNGWETSGSLAKMPSVVVSYTVLFYPSTEGFYIVESGDVDNLREVVSLANDAAYEGNPIWIFLPWGQYDLGDESLTLSGNYVSLIGEDNKKTHIFSNNATQTLLVTGKNAYIQDLLIENTGSGSAVHDMGSNNVYHNDSIVADKKAFLTEGNWKQRCYVDSCSFEGSEDLVCGSGDIYFQGSYFNLGNDGKHLSAQKTDADNARYAKGYVFNGCTAWGEGSYSIARPWAEEPSATWLNSRFTGTSLTQGFGTMRSSLNVHFHESNNTNGDGYSTIQIPHTVEECQPSSSDPIFMFDSDTLSWFAVENFFAEYTKGSTTLTAWRPDNIAKQMFITDATLNNNVVNFNSNGSTLYLIEGFTADGNVEFLFTTAKTFVPMKNFLASYDYVTVRAANGRGGFGKPVKCNVIESSDEQELLATVTLNANGYASFSYPQQVQIVGATPCKAFYNPGTYESSASGGVTVNGSSCTLSVVDNGKDIVPAETGVILFGSPNATVSIYSSSEDISESSDWARKDDGLPLDDSSRPSNNTHNLLPNTGTARSCTSSDLLSAESGYVAIYALSGNTIKLMNVTNKIGQNKAFFGFKSTLGSNAASARILFIDHEVVGIDNIHSTDDTLEMMFDLPGRKTDVEKGLIVKGNKVIMVK